MATRLPDGTVLPSFLGIRRMGSGMPGARSLLRDTELRVGEVTLAYPPTHARNLNKKLWEYVVRVDTCREDGISEAPQMYRAVVADRFGVPADRCRYRLRAAKREPTAGQTLADGAMVLLLCPSGDKSQAVIVGAVRNGRDEAVQGDAMYEFVVNGVGVVIGVDGSVKLTVTGPTNADGTAAGEAKPSTVTISPGGAVKVESQTVEVKAKTVDVESDETNVVSKKVNLGGKALDINPMDEVVVGSGIDAFTGTPYKALGNTSTVVKAKK